MKLYLISAMLWLLSRVHPRHADWVAVPLAGLVWLSAKRLRRVSRRNLAVCFPDLPEAERERLARRGIYHYARNLMDAGIQWYWPPRKFQPLFDPIDGIELLQAAKARGKGLMILVPHFGSWELITLCITEYLDGAVLYKPGSEPAIDAHLTRRRARMGLNMVPATVRGLKAVYQSLAEGRGIAILPDQEPKSGEGRFAPFFGVPARTGVLVPRLLRKTGATAVFVVCERRAGGRYRLVVQAADPELYSDDLDTSLAALNRGVERCIQVAPEQYLWAYKRFSARPEGEPPIY